MGKCSPNNAKNNSQTFKLTPGHLEVLTVLTQNQKLQLLKELYLSLDDEGKVKCCNDIFFEGNSSLKRVIISLIQSTIATNMDEMMTFMDEAFLTLAMSNGLCSNPKYFVSNSIKAITPDKNACQSANMLQFLSFSSCFYKISYIHRTCHSYKSYVFCFSNCYIVGGKMTSQTCR